jgi:thiopurine S-methyltransferase
MSIPKQNTDWKQSWKNGKLGFHLEKPNPSLCKYAQLLESEQNILVPLCGKTLDMHFLHQNGHHVYGVELVQQAIQDFFLEWNVDPIIDGNRTKHDNITIINSNIFTVQSEKIPSIDGIFDRAALVALPPEIRQQYAEHILSLLKKGGTLLLITYDMPRPQNQGPPFPVREMDIPSLFGTATSVELLEEIHKTSQEEPRLASRGVKWSKEHIWIIKK